ncbi:hypothetical protein GNI_078670, partial [Gregarina niphandrodes]
MAGESASPSSRVTATSTLPARPTCLAPIGSDVWPFAGGVGSSAGSVELEGGAESSASAVLAESSPRATPPRWRVIYRAAVDDVQMLVSRSTPEDSSASVTVQSIFVTDHNGLPVLNSKFGAGPAQRPVLAAQVSADSLSLDCSDFRLELELASLDPLEPLMGFFPEQRARLLAILPFLKKNAPAPPTPASPGSPGSLGSPSSLGAEPGRVQSFITLDTHLLDQHNLMSTLKLGSVTSVISQPAAALAVWPVFPVFLDAAPATAHRATDADASPLEVFHAALYRGKFSATPRPETPPTSTPSPADKPPRRVDLKLSGFEVW